MGFVFTIIGLFACTNNTVGRAKQALDAHDLATAEKLYREALGHDPSDTKALAGLGWTYHLALKPEEAANSFTQCLNQQPTNTECIRGRSSVILSQGDILLAETWIERAQQISPDDPELQITMALLHLAKGEITQGREILESVVQRFPTNSRFRLPYSESLFREGQSERALENVEEALKISAPRRTVAMLWVLRARILLDISAKSENCSDVSKIQQWVDEAERSLFEVKETGVAVPNLAIIERQMHRRRTHLQEKCGLKSD